jgi:hypothetical protein
MSRLPFWYVLGSVALLLLLEPSCRKRQVAVPVAPQPAPTGQPHSVEPTAAPAQDSSAPQPATTTGNPQQSPYQVNKPAQTPPAAPRKPSRSASAPSTSPSPQANTPAPATTAPAPVQPPLLGNIVTSDQQRQLNAAIDQSLSRAQASLASIANRELSKDQQGLVEQIRNIMQQAQASRNSDLPGAKSLAERAEVLAKDLAGSFH